MTTDLGEYHSLVSDRISEGGNAIGSVLPSVRFSTFIQNRQTVDVALLRVSWS